MFGCVSLLPSMTSRRLTDVALADVRDEGGVMTVLQLSVLSVSKDAIPESEGGYLTESEGSADTRLKFPSSLAPWYKRRPLLVPLYQEFPPQYRRRLWW